MKRYCFAPVLIFVRTMKLGSEGNTIIVLAQLIVLFRNNCLHSVQSYIKAPLKGIKQRLNIIKNW